MLFPEREGNLDSSIPRQGLDYSAALELATLGRKAKECGRQSRRGGGLWRSVSGACVGRFSFFIGKNGTCVLVMEDVYKKV